jgi:hypothetical protein
MAERPRAIIVSLAGSRSGAERTAHDLGTTSWDAVAAEFGIPPTPSSTLT